MDLHHAQDTLKLLDNEEFLDLLNYPLTRIIVIHPFSNPSIEIDSLLETVIFHIGHQRDHAQELPLHLEDLLKNYKQIPLKTMTIRLRNFQNQKTNLQPRCIPLK